MGDESWYVIQLRDSSDLIRRLVVMGVPYHDITSQLKSSQKSISFPSSSLKDVLAALDKKESMYSVTASSFENIYYLTLMDDEDDFYAKRPSSHFESWSELVIVMEAFYKLFGIRIIPDNPHGSVLPPVPCKDERLLYVHFWSTPIPSSRSDLTKAFGVVLTGGQKDGLAPTHSGTGIRDDDGRVIAEYVENNLYILFDLPHAEGDSVTEVFTRIMRAFLSIKGKTDGDIARFYQAVRGTVGGSSKEQFIKECSQLYEKHLSDMEKSLSAYDNDISDQQKKLVDMMRNRDVLQAKVDPLRESVQKRREWALQEYDTLLHSAHVKDVSVVGKTIHVYTDMISIDYAGDRYNIGEFRIDIYTDGSNEGVRAFNLTNPKGSVAHPHVKIDGHCCLGNISEGVARFLSEYQYVPLAQIMVKYLQSYNPENAYSTIKNWR